MTTTKRDSTTPVVVGSGLDMSAYPPGTFAALAEATGRHPYRLLFLVEAGAGAYGYPPPGVGGAAGMTPLRGVHTLPLARLVDDLNPPTPEGERRHAVVTPPPHEKPQEAQQEGAARVELMSYEMGDFLLRLLDRQHGPFLEWLCAPTHAVAVKSGVYEELRALAARVPSRAHYYSYLHYALDLLLLFGQEPRASRLLDVLRVLLTGRHLLRAAGQVEVWLPRLVEEATRVGVRGPGGAALVDPRRVDDLLARAREGGRGAALDERELAGWRRVTKRLMDALSDAARESRLPEGMSAEVRQEASALLRRARLGAAADASERK